MPLPSEPPPQKNHKPLPTHELTSSLVVNKRTYGPKTFLVWDNKLHTVIFKTETPGKQYQVTYRTTVDNENDRLKVATSVNTTLFQANFELMNNQRSSVLAHTDPAEVQVVVSVRKLVPSAPAGAVH